MSGPTNYSSDGQELFTEERPAIVQIADLLDVATEIRDVYDNVVELEQQLTESLPLLEGKASVKDIESYQLNQRNKLGAVSGVAFKDNFINRIDGEASGQNGYRMIGGTLSQFVNGTLEVTSQYSNTRGFVLYEGITEGTVRIKVNASTNPVFLMGVRHEIPTNNRWCVWKTGANVEFGWCLNSTITSKITMTPPTGDYYVEVKIPLLKVGAIYEIRLWSTSSSRPDSPSGTYTLQTGDPIIFGDCITLQSIAPSANTVTKISEVLIYKGNSPVNVPLNQVYYNGRWSNMVVNGKNVMTTINQGSEFYFEIDGTSAVTLNFEIISDTNPYVVISINGGSFTRYEVTGTIALSNLPTGKNLIKVVASGIREGDAVWNEGKGLAFSGLTVGTNGTVKPFVPKTKPIMFFGDSITAGVNVFDTGASALNNSGENSYAYLTAKKLNASPIVVGFGGTGVVVSGSGGVPKASSFLDRMMNDRLAKTEYPASIVVNFGTNDRYQTSAVFNSAYTLFIQSLKNKFPNVPIFCVLPFPLKPFKTEIMTIANDNGCYFVDTTSWVVTTTDGVHPNVAGNDVASSKLADFIKQTLGDLYYL